MLNIQTFGMQTTHQSSCEGGLWHVQDWIFSGHWYWSQVCSLSSESFPLNNGYLLAIRDTKYLGKDKSKYSFKYLYDYSSIGTFSNQEKYIFSHLYNLWTKICLKTQSCRQDDYRLSWYLGKYWAYQINIRSLL